MIRTPRYLRPHSIVIKHKNGEDDNLNAISDDTSIIYVRFDENYKIIQNQKGINSDDDALCFIDLNDVIATKNGVRCKYINHTKYRSQIELFSIFKNDLIVFNDKEYTITSINEICSYGNGVEYVEVRANAS